MLIISLAFLFFYQNVFAGTVTSISYGPSSSSVGSYVQASDTDFIIFTPTTALANGSTITVTFPTGTNLTSANILLADFTIGQATQGNCTIAGVDTVPSTVSVNELDRTITFTVAVTSLSSGVIPACTGLGQVTIKTSVGMGGNEIQHPTTSTTSGILQIDTSVGSDTGSINNVSFIPGVSSYLKITGTDIVTAGSTNEITVTAYDIYDNVVSFGSNNYDGSKSLTFSGLSNAPNLTVPTIEAISAGDSMSVTFTNGVSNSNALTLIAYKAETASLDVSDGSINSTSNTSYDLDLTINPASLNDFTIVPNTYSPTTDDTFTVVLTARDLYQNIKTDYNGSKSVAWTWASGGNNSPAGNIAQKPSDGDQSFTNGITENISSFKIVKTETATITATADTKSGTSNTITASPGVLNDFSITTENDQVETAGIEFNVTTVARDTEQNTKTNYTGSKSVVWTWTATASPDGNSPTKPADDNETFSSGSLTKSGFTFTDAGETPIITITADSESGNTDNITVNTAGANKLTFSTEPSSSVVAGTNLSTQPVVTIKDFFGNTVNSSASITLATVLSSDDTTAGNGTLNATTNPLSASSGTATFSGVNYTVGEEIKIKATSSGLTQILSNAIDVSAITISNVATSTTSSTATITWTTNTQTSSKINYGLTNSYGNTTSETDTSPRVTSHSVVLSGLSACSTYYFRVRSTATGGNEIVGSGSTFTTTGCVGGSTILAETSATITSASGGNVELTSGDVDVSLVVPAGATDEDALFQVKQLDTDSVMEEATDTLDTADPVDDYTFDFKAFASDDGTPITSFNQSIIVTIEYTEDDIALFQEPTLVIYRHDGDDWQELSNCSVDTDVQTVTCNTTGFSVFALFGDTNQTSSDSASSSGSSSSSLIGSSHRTFTKNSSLTAIDEWLDKAYPQFQNLLPIYQEATIINISNNSLGMIFQGTKKDPKNEFIKNEPDNHEESKMDEDIREDQKRVDFQLIFIALISFILVGVLVKKHNSLFS